MKAVLKTINFKSDIVQSALAFFVKIGAGVASYLLFVVAARTMGADSFGVFSALFSIVMLTGIAGSFGQQIFLVKEIPRTEENDDKPTRLGTYIFSIVVTLIAAILGAGIFIYVAPYLANGVTLQILITGAILSFLYSISQMTIGALRVQDATITAIATRDFLWRILVILGILFFAYVIFGSENKSAIGSAYVFGIMSVALVLIVAWHVVLMKRHVSATLKDIRPVYTIKRWVESSSALALIGLISSADLYLYTIVLGKILTPEATGAFFASLKTVELVNLFLMAVALVVSTDLSRLVAAKKTEELQEKCNMAILLQAIPAIGSSLFIIVVAPFLLSFFAPEYVAYDGLLRLLVLGMLVNALTGATVLMMQLGNMHWRQLAYQGVGLGLSALLLPVFVGMFGVVGAAISFLLYKLGWNALAVLAIRKKLGVDPSLIGLIFKNNKGFAQLLKMLFASAREKI